MKEWLIRLGCVLLGAIMTLGTIQIKNFIVNRADAESVVSVSAARDEDEVVLPEVKEDVEVVADYDLEAQIKYQDMIDKKQEETSTEVDLPEEMTVEEEIPVNSIEAAPVKWIKDYPLLNSEGVTIEDKLATRSSYDETMAVNAFDKMVIENSKVDFSDVKITIMGDSLTAGTNLSEEEMPKYNWPTQLQEILGCKEVVNLGIGGSTVSRCIEHFSMCDRWNEISPDSDIIIIMGGSNDMLFEDKWQFGELEYERRMTNGTFCGDLDEMLGNMKWKFRDHNDVNYCKLIYINPPSTILNDAVYAVDPGNMVAQSSFAEAINVIAPTYGFEVIDMYNNNILNSHDADINAQFVYDGIHCNKEGYKIIAEHVASQLIQRIEE